MQTIIQKTLKDTMFYKNIPIFSYQINYPSFSTTCSLTSAQIINEYYARTAKNTEEYCRTVLYEQALESARYIQVNNPPFNSYTFDADYYITFNVGCVTSLYIDTYTYMGGAHGETKRTSNTWDFRTGNQLQLYDMNPLTFLSISMLQKQIEQQIADRMVENPGSYFSDYRTLLQNTFNPNSFFLRPNNMIIYYQQYDIAPYYTGLPEFSFPIKGSFSYYFPES